MRDPQRRSNSWSHGFRSQFFGKGLRDPSSHNLFVFEIKGLFSKSTDVTLKENITPISNAIDKVLSISGNTFTWNEKSIYNGEEGTGIIAQEIEALGLPGLTTTRENGTKAVRYDRLVPLFIEAIKELSNKVESLEK